MALALVLMQAAEFIPHHHHDGILICLEDDSDEGGENDDTLCITKASYLLNETHHEFCLSAFIPVWGLEEPAEFQEFGGESHPLGQVSSYTVFRPGPSALRAPPVSSITV